MLRRLHSAPGLVAGLIVAFMAITGSVLSVQPVMDHFAVRSTTVAMNVAALANAVSTHLTGVERIVHAASGAVTAYYDGGKGVAAALIDPATGAVLGDYSPSPIFVFFTELHRSLFLGMNGRFASGMSALALAVLAVGGMLLLVKRLGGWRKIFVTVKGTISQRLHVELARIAIVGLLVSSLTGGYMSLTSFGVIASTSPVGQFPASVDGGTPALISSLSALQAVPLADLRELVFPYAGDPTDVFTLTTASGQGYVDQATGALLNFTPKSVGQSIYETLYMLHTGQGLWWFGALLGLAALCVPVLAVTGTSIWWLRRRNQIKVANNAGARHADTVILVGSEGNSTWGFAQVLHRALVNQGHQVHTGAMNDLATAYPAARHLLVLAATYGDGSAPTSANRFLSRMARFKPHPNLSFAVLGFGDRSFSHYCRFAQVSAAALAEKGMDQILPMATVDRQSPQAFAQWGQDLGGKLGNALALEHVPTFPPTISLSLASRTDFGMEVQAPTVVMRFTLPKREISHWWEHLAFGKTMSFQPGDLVGILPPGSPVPRFYSLASASGDGELEICVRKQTGGLCSEFLHNLQPGERIQAFVKANPDFRPRKGISPIVLIGAGTGIAPLVGFVRHNDRHRPLHLYFGGRDPASDFLYAPILGEAIADNRLAGLVTAFSRIVGGGYVQDRIREDGAAIRDLVSSGAQIMVCGGDKWPRALSKASIWRWPP
ncbi:PepSY domain-containing protein [Devosia rhodophyticola]|uniref:PepSY domain-containing protein n=1 Tax=Devosia rhodophyticola TaxID=3026423 RepID=A0ABY7Z158_9HYPH|nr:PepSY domain-containing protein [Devosia rhodophyticola]WDR06955.1 PepSY domain-containing protein [Devosia rhodophyticola]